ncbi:hypothetical protein TNCV_2951731 [Trichonephila clavipes]|nr:hypothetical protein TNCV_2951731 [Trichonephila clavipes]
MTSQNKRMEPVRFRFLHKREGARYTANVPQLRCRSRHLTMVQNDEINISLERARKSFTHPQSFPEDPAQWSVSPGVRGRLLMDRTRGEGAEIEWDKEKLCPLEWQQSVTKIQRDRERQHFLQRHDLTPTVSPIPAALPASAPQNFSSSF